VCVCVCVCTYINRASCCGRGGGGRRSGRKIFLRPRTRRQTERADHYQGRRGVKYIARGETRTCLQRYNGDGKSAVVRRTGETRGGPFRERNRPTEISIKSTKPHGVLIFRFRSTRFPLVIRLRNSYDE